VSATTVEVPDSLGELLTPTWLDAALSPRFPGVHVTSVTPGPVVERLSTNARFRIDCAPAPPGMPLTLCAKGYFSEQGRAIADVGMPEALFYRDLAPDTGVHTLRAVWADVHPQTHHGVVITEDVIEAGGVFLDALSPYSVDQVASTLEQLARLHAFAWERPERLDATWLAPRIARTLAVRGVREINQNFEGPNGAGVPPEIRDAARLIDAYGVLALREPGPGWTVIHGDAHVGNVFLDGQGRPGLLDWQLVQHGHWSIDVGYHIASALEPAERARVERDLLALYLEQLARHGAHRPELDVAWLEYRRGVVYGFFLWAITQYVKPDIIAALLRRLGTAALELDSFAALQSDGRADGAS
jgi:hypothetical protein